MSSYPLLSNKKEERITKFQKSSTEGETVYLDPSNKKDRRLILMALEISGRTKGKYPNLHKALAKPQKYEGKAIDKVHLVDIGKTASGKATATIWATSKVPTMIYGGVTLLFHKNKLVAKGDNMSVRSGFLSCSTRGVTAQDAGDKLHLLFVGHSTDDRGNTRFFSYTNSAPTAAAMVAPKASPAVAMATESSIQATIQAPVTLKGNPQVVIAVGRKSGVSPSNADYIYVESSNLSNPNLICPFKGNVALAGTIDLPSLTASDMLTNIIIVNGSGSAEYLDRDSTYTTDADMVAAFSVGSAPNVLEWNFPYDQLGYQKTKSIVYDKGSLTSELVSYFYYAFNSIPLDEGVSPPFFVCSMNSPEEQSVNCTMIDDLMFWWHCLAKGTMVTLEDGSTIPIEDIDETYRVQTPQGSMAVRATVLGMHDSSNEHDKIFELNTECGKMITATSTHMIFMKNNQPRKIENIKAGDIIMTNDGVAKVASNEIIEHEGMFYGLVLGNEEELASKKYPKNYASFYANGIVTGDHETMQYHINKTNNDLLFVASKMNKKLHTDLASALEDKRY